MRVVLVFMAFWCGASWAQGALTLQEALRLAGQGNAALQAAQAGLAAAEGEVKESRGLLHNNPELSFERGRRTARELDGFESRIRESAVGLSQTFEVAGQAGHRREAARRELVATRAEIQEAQRRLNGEVEQLFYQVLALQRRIASEEESASLAESAATAVGKRVAAGEDSKLDGNLAKVEAERARNQALNAAEQLGEARAKLASLLQLPADRFPDVVGELAPTRPPYSLQQLLSTIPGRPQLDVLANREEAARSRLALERASVFPDVTVGLNSAREGPPELRERVSTLSITLPLPLFRRNDAAIGKARTELDRAQIERRASLRDAEGQVRALWRKLQSLEDRLRRLTASVLPSLDENLSLSNKAYRAGEIGILQLVVVNRQVLDARRDHLEALTEFVQARVALEQAAGWSPDVQPSSSKP